MSENIIILASASNEGARNPITFPATVEKVFCIGSADGDGRLSSFSPPEPGREKYSAVGEGVVGAYATNIRNESPDPCRQLRLDGTSTAAPCAAGVAALLLDYLRQFESREVENPVAMRKLFIKMSAGTAGAPYRFLAPWYLFRVQDPQQHIKEVLAKPAGMSNYNSFMILTGF